MDYATDGPDSCAPQLTYLVPDLSSGIAPARRHPLGDVIARRAINWLAHVMGDFLPAAQVEEFTQSGTEEFSLLVWPDALPDRIQTVTSLIAFTFMADDICAGRYESLMSASEVKAWGSQLLAALSGRDGCSSPRWAREVAVAAASVTAGATEAWLRRDLVAWAAMQIGDTALVSEGYRTLDGSLPCPAVTAYCLGLDMTQAMAEPQMRAATKTAMTAGVLVNDILSLGKEYFRGDDKRSRVRRAMLTEGLTLQQAVDQVCARIFELHDEFQLLREQVLESPAGRVPGAAQYLAAIESAMAGNLKFTATATRYFRRGSAWDGTGPARIEIFADCAVTIPLPAVRRE
jgi:Terpene synthase family 2, C-terminal metal binding